MKSLLSLLAALEKNIPFINQQNLNVSAVPVGWHIEHSLLAFIKMISATEHADPSQFKKQFNLKKTIVLTLGKIPRGRARVPDSVKPGEMVSIETIQPLLEKAKQKAVLFEQLKKDMYFTHPVFGDVRVEQARRVIAIHTVHHIKIINDILKK